MLKTTFFKDQVVSENLLRPLETFFHTELVLPLTTNAVFVCRSKI